MPQLITRKRRTNPASKRYMEPHSPWQKAVDSVRLIKGWSYADLAGRIDEKLDRGVFWIWLHSRNGCPSPRSLTAARMAALAEAIGIPLPRLKELYDASRHRFTPSELGPAPESIDAMQVLIDTLQNDSRRNIDRKWVLNLAKRLQASAKSGSKS